MPELEINIIKEILEDFPFEVFIETGTYAGFTIISMEPYFDELHTIEIKKEQYEESKNKYTGDKIKFYLGDSESILKIIIPKINKPSIFFLDAHWSEGSTGRGKKDVPLIEEIKIINDLFHEKCVIIVDDFRLFGSGPSKGDNVNWEEIDEDVIDKILCDRIIKKEYKESIYHSADRIIYHLSKL